MTDWPSQKRAIMKNGSGHDSWPAAITIITALWHKNSYDTYLPNLKILDCFEKFPKFLVTKENKLINFVYVHGTMAQ